MLCVFQWHQLWLVTWAVFCQCTVSISYWKAEPSVSTECPSKHGSTARFARVARHYILCYPALLKSTSTPFWPSLRRIPAKRLGWTRPVTILSRRKKSAPFLAILSLMQMLEMASIRLRPNCFCYITFYCTKTHDWHTSKTTSSQGSLFTLIRKLSSLNYLYDIWSAKPEESSTFTEVTSLFSNHKQF